MNKILTSFGLLFVFSILNGCAGSSGPIPEDHFYMLTGKPLQAESKNKLLKGALEIARFNAKSIYNERAVLYAHEDRPLQLKQYHYHYWTDSPAQMLQGNFATIFSKVGLADTVSVSNPRIDYDYSLTGNILRFERVMGSGNGKSLVSISLALTKRGEGKPLILRTYTHQVDAESSSLYYSIEAFNNAISLISSEFVNDVADHCATGTNMCGYNK